MIGGLAELASLPGVPSDTTLRQLIRDNDDFPIIKHGKNGVGYEIDFNAALAWLKARAEREQQEARERAAAVRQFGLDLGLGGSEEPEQPGLSIAERKQLLEEELVAMKISERRGVLVQKADVDAAIGELIGFVASRMEDFTARLAKKVDLDREVRAAIDSQLEADRAKIAQMMEKMGNGVGDPDTGPAMDDSAL